MELRSRYNDGRVDKIYGVVANAAVKDKFLDFRDGLTLAYLEDYGMLMGAGGSDHNFNSGIYVLIQDNTPTAPAPNAKALIPCWVFDQLAQVCRDNIYAPKNEDRAAALIKGKRVSGYESVPVNVLTLTAAFGTWLKNCMMASARIIKKVGHQAGPFADFGQAFKAASETLSKGQLSTGTENPYTEYSYHQDRFNTYRKTQDGYCTMTQCDIQRNQFRNSKNPQDGTVSKTVSKYPWSVIITTYEALPSQGQNVSGQVYPNQATKRNEKKLFVNISDEQMFSCVYAVQHFIQVWELTYGPALVQAGIAEKEKQLANARNNNYNNGR